MTTQSVVALNNLGVDFNIGSITPNKIRVDSTNVFLPTPILGNNTLMAALIALAGLSTGGLTAASQADVQAGANDGKVVEPNVLAGAAGAGLSWPILTSTANANLTIQGTNTGTGDGVQGVTTTSTGSGVHGISQGAGTGPGVFGENTGSGNGPAVYGKYSGSGTGDAVLGLNYYGNGGSAVHGQVYGPGNGAGVIGEITGAGTGTGVLGQVTGTGTGDGVWGLNHYTIGSGVRGSCYGAGSSGHGVYGQNSGGGNGDGVFGEITGTGGTGDAVAGTQHNGGGHGGHFASYGPGPGDGCRGEVYGAGNGNGVTGIVWTSGTGAGVVGVCNGGNGYAIQAYGNIVASGTITSSDGALKLNQEVVNQNAAIAISKQIVWKDFVKFQDPTFFIAENAAATDKYNKRVSNAQNSVAAAQSALTTATAALATAQAAAAAPNAPATATAAVASAQTTVTNAQNALAAAQAVLATATAATPVPINTDIAIGNAALTVGEQAGVIAQDLQALLKSVGYGDYVVSKSASGYLTVDYNSLQAIINAGVAARLEALETAMAVLAGASSTTAAH